MGTNFDAEVNNSLFRKDWPVILALNAHLATILPVRLSYVAAGYKAGQVLAYTSGTASPFFAVLFGVGLLVKTPSASCLDDCLSDQCLLRPRARRWAAGFSAAKSAVEPADGLQSHGGHEFGWPRDSGCQRSPNPEVLTNFGVGFLNGF